MYTDPLRKSLGVLRRERRVAYVRVAYREEPPFIENR
jgi:hypothetical protein